MINDKNRLEKYFKERNVNSIYKILPLYEENNPNLLSYISSLLTELYGLERCIEIDNQEFITLVAIISGLHIEARKSDNKEVIKREVFRAISISKTLADKVVA